MIYAISKDNRAEFARELDCMYRDRKRVFVDWLKWGVPVVDGIYEMDQYDTDETVYIVSADPETGRHLASVRLMPTTRPHMLEEIFPMLCEDGVPIGDDIWEMTRICLSPSLAREEARRNLGLAWLGAIEFCLPRGITRITGLTHVMFISNFLAAGIDIEPLGPPKDFDGMQYGAIQVQIDDTLYRREQGRLSQRTPILHDDRSAAAA